MYVICITWLCVYVSKRKWYVYMYVNKHVELAQQRMAVLKMYVLLFFIIKGWGSYREMRTSISLEWDVFICMLFSSYLNALDSGIDHGAEYITG